MKILLLLCLITVSCITTSCIAGSSQGGGGGVNSAPYTYNIVAGNNAGGLVDTGINPTNVIAITNNVISTSLTFTGVNKFTNYGNLFYGSIVSTNGSFTVVNLINTNQIFGQTPIGASLYIDPVDGESLDYADFGGNEQPAFNMFSYNGRLTYSFRIVSDSAGGATIQGIAGKGMTFQEIDTNGAEPHLIPIYAGSVSATNFIQVGSGSYFGSSLLINNSSSIAGIGFTNGSISSTNGGLFGFTNVVQTIYTNFAGTNNAIVFDNFHNWVATFTNSPTTNFFLTLSGGSGSLSIQCYSNITIVPLGYKTTWYLTPSNNMVTNGWVSYTQIGSTNNISKAILETK